MHDSSVPEIDAMIGQHPGKVIAVHLNYPSRAAQRGRTPAQPGYFLKPSTSLSASATPIERPAGCELLAFEGEIALIIGKDARRIYEVLDDFQSRKPIDVIAANRPSASTASVIRVRASAK